LPSIEAPAGWAQCRGGRLGDPDAHQNDCPQDAHRGEDRVALPLSFTISRRCASGTPDEQQQEDLQMSENAFGFSNGCEELAL
jgi:hypothetical protein